MNEKTNTPQDAGYQKATKKKGAPGPTSYTYTSELGNTIEVSRLPNGAKRVRVKKAPRPD